MASLYIRPHVSFKALCLAMILGLLGLPHPAWSQAHIRQGLYDREQVIAYYGEVFRLYRCTPTCRVDPLPTTMRIWVEGPEDEEVTGNRGRAVYSFIKPYATEALSGLIRVEWPDRRDDADVVLRLSLRTSGNGLSACAAVRHPVASEAGPLEIVLPFAPLDGESKANDQTMKDVSFAQCLTSAVSGMFDFIERQQALIEPSFRESRYLEAYWRALWAIRNMPAASPEAFVGQLEKEMPE